MSNRGFAELTNLFKPILDWNKSRLDCFVLVVFGVIQLRTVNLSYLATAIISPATKESSYRRLQRFFKQFDICPTLIGKLLISMLRAHCPGSWIFAIDRTNWQLGKAHINVLVITVILGKVGFPVCWVTLPKKTKKGNSRQFHRIKLAKILLKIVSVEDIEAIVMDREFYGEKWLSWLSHKGIPYVLRIKANTHIDGVKLGQLLRQKQHCQKYHIFNAYGQNVYLSCKWLGKTRKSAKQRIILISNALAGEKALEAYRMRWGIEIFFAHCKKNGFNLEDTHMTYSKKMNKLLAVVAVAFCICYLKSPMAKHQNSSIAKRKSTFRDGMEEIQKLLQSHLKKELNKLLSWLEKAILYHCKALPITASKQLILKGFQKIVV